MFAICLEASHQKGMGHLFRMLNFAKFLDLKNQQFIFIINSNQKTKDILKLKNYKYEVVDLSDLATNWESRIILRYKIFYWINDRLDTDEKHSKNILRNHIKLITFDDSGSGSKHCDLNICGLLSKDANGKKILKGIEYLVLDPEINSYKKERKKINNILVTLGGSDTHGVTIKIIKLLKKYNLQSTIHTGPSFKHQKELEQELNENFKYIKFVSSLIKEFEKYDLAITGGGITPFEANASGLPCLIVANEYFEIANAKFLNTLGSSIFLGYHNDIDETNFKDIEKINIPKMSQNGLLKLTTNAVEKIYKEIIKL